MIFAFENVFYIYFQHIWMNMSDIYEACIIYSDGQKSWLIPLKILPHIKKYHLKSIEKVYDRPCCIHKYIHTTLGIFCQMGK